MTTYYVSESKLAGLVRQKGGTRAFLPAATGGLSWLDCAAPDFCPEVLRQPRSAQSPRGLFMPALESVGRYSSTAVVAASAETATALAGIRACELRALAYLDKVFMQGPFEDPSYRARREKTVIVSCDCVDCAETCFCTQVGGNPFPVTGYDVNLTPVPEGFLLEIATERGRAWLGEPAAAGLVEAGQAQLVAGQQARQNMVARVRQQNARFGLSADDKAPPALPNESDEAWQKFAADCVECGGCTNICPTCHCFYLYDQVVGSAEFERVRNWDSCLLSSYHRMAGGVHMKLTPRPKLYSRLANRILHKFAYSPQQYGMLGCVGCGRCIDACLGEIDIRQAAGELGR